MTNTPSAAGSQASGEPRTAAATPTPHAANVAPAEESPTSINEGPAAAALLAAGIGAVVLGLLTTLAEASTTIKDSLALTDAVGPLSGKISYAVIAWLVAWAILHPTVGRRARLSASVLIVTAVLIVLGLLGTFPIFFQLFFAE